MSKGKKLTKALFNPIVTGTIIGVLAPLLVHFGNPPNMGICVACFERDMAGAMGLHRASVVQYFRPEIIGFVLGAFIAAIVWKEWKSRTGSAPLVRFSLGVFAMIGALVFLGCPWRALLRLAGGDLNAVIGLLGLAAGVVLGIGFLRRGFNLGRARPSMPATGLMLPVLLTAGLLLTVLVPKIGEGLAFFSSQQGPGSQHAPLLISLFIGILVGVFAQRSRFCTIGAIRDTLIIRDRRLLTGIIALVITAFATNLLLSVLTDATYFRLSFAAQPVAHSSYLWNFAGMVLAGLAFVLSGGCPGRQLFLSGEGDGDAAVFVLGMIAGAALAHNFGLAAIPDRIVEGSLITGGPALPGMVAVGLGIVFCLGVGFSCSGKYRRG
ncbi:MAG: YedE-related selenium metabolism membrane protein [Candidatus Aegiribacteria sp.]|nr:YedE-related selenium metabolism membrane protein [Candidatus Aegiribacteria sp.]